MTWKGINNKPPGTVNTRTTVVLIGAVGTVIVSVTLGRQSDASTNDTAELIGATTRRRERLWNEETVKGKGMFYIAEYVVCWTTQSTLHFTEDHPMACAIRHQFIRLLWEAVSHSAIYCAKTIHSHFHHCL